MDNKGGAENEAGLRVKTQDGSDRDTVRRSWLRRMATQNSGRSSTQSAARGAACVTHLSFEIMDRSASFETERCPSKRFAKWPR